MKPEDFKQGASVVHKTLKTTGTLQAPDGALGAIVLVDHSVLAMWPWENIEMREPTPFDKRSCYDCGHIRSAMNLWCGNAQANKVRGTSIPGCIHCPYWAPDWSMIPKEYRTAEYGYVSKLEKFKKFLCNLL